MYSGDIPSEYHFPTILEMSDGSSGHTFISNAELILDPDNPVTGSNARKVLSISARAIWYSGYDTLILPVAPETAFVDYAASFGRGPEIIVPEGIDPDRLSILHGLGDRQVKLAAKDSVVESYVASRALYDFTQEHGGTYVGGDPGESVLKANNKGLYRTFAEGIVAIPEGTLEKGLEAIALAVQARLQTSGSAFVRHAHSGGGHGNRAFKVKDGEIPCLDAIKEQLADGQMHLWADGEALVEEYLDLQHSPAVTFKGERGFLFDNLQITTGNDYRGSWSPTPPEICDPASLVRIGDGFAARLLEIGYNGHGNTDLGVDASGRQYGFEINGRMTGALHAISIGERTLGPWEYWRAEGHVVKSVDHFTLRDKTMTFEQLHDALGETLLASFEHPYGVIITLPPVDGVAGIHFQNHGYEKTEMLYQKVLERVGDQQANQHDNPLIK